MSTIISRPPVLNSARPEVNRKALTDDQKRERKEEIREKALKGLIELLPDSKR
jgi:hypothetical protein